MNLREAIYQPKLRAFTVWLRNYKHRTDSSSLSEYQQLLSQVKYVAVSENDQLTAKAVWCLEAIGRIQDYFVSAFMRMKNTKYKAAWDLLERCEIDISFLDRHFIEDDGEFGIEHARFHTRQFQELYPGKWGFSLAFTIEDVRCSICGIKRTIRSGCDHKVGEIYDGEMCFRDIVKIGDALHVALVENPVQKSTVIFPPDDDYRFTLVKYVVEGLRNPWVGWSYHKEERRKHYPVFANVGRNYPCPCGSSLKYKHCCLKKEVVLPHFQITFEEQPPKKLPHLIIQTGKDQDDMVSYP